MSKRDGMALLEAIASEEVVPMGEVTVEIRDERGRVRDRETSDNFISKVWKAYARAVLRLPWQAFGYNIQNFKGSYAGNSTPSYNAGVYGVWPQGLSTIPQLPIHAIGCWNDTAAEDSVNEHQIYLPGNATGMVAYATRWPLGGTTGARGAVNVSESYMEEDKVRFVFDWLTSQGNGTFQSVGWFKPGCAAGIPHYPHGDAHRGYALTQAPTPTAIITGATGLYIGSGYFHPANGKWYFPIRRQTGSANTRICSVDFSAVLDDSNAGILGVAPTPSLLAITNESDEFAPASMPTTTDQNNVAMFGIDSGGNRIFGYITSGSTWRWGKIPASGANTSYATDTGMSGFLVGCVIGTTVYQGSQGDSSIHVASTSTGTYAAALAIDSNVSALCTLCGITTPRVTSITTDGTDLMVLYSQTGTGDGNKHLLVRLNTSGVLQQIYGTPALYQSSGHQTETSSSPWGGIIAYGSGNWESSMYPTYLLSPDEASTTQTAENILTKPGLVAIGDFGSSN